MILKELVKTISERMSEVRGGTRRTRLFVGVALCVALVALVGCPDNGGDGGGATPDTAPPVITLTGTTVIVVDIGETFTDPGFEVNDDDPNYTGMVTPTIRDGGGTEVSANTFTDAAGVYTITYTAPADAADNTPVAVTRAVRVGADTAPPVITLTGTTVIVVDIGETFTDPGFDVNDDDPNYTGMVTPTIRDGGGTEVSADAFTAAAGIYTITYTAPADAADNTPVAVTRAVRVGADADGNNRIEIYTLDHLNAIRYNLAGTSYRASADGTEIQCGSTGTTACEGYELTRDLDFADGDSYTDGTVNADWRPDAADSDSATNEGWNPIGTGTGAASFSGSFFGNGFVISNLYVRRSGKIGLFGVNSGAIQRIGVADGNIYGGAGEFDTIGGLVGDNTGTVTASYATGNFDGGGGRVDVVGGLVGNNSGTITVSYATADVDGGAGNNDFVGGLVGSNTGGTTTSSYATGNVDGGAGNNDFVGGLVGSNDSGDTTASYATGDVDGGTGSLDGVGSLVGTGNLDTANYGFGTVTGETVAIRRSTDASPSGTVANPCAITQTNSSTTPANLWDTAQWDFGTTIQRPIVLHEGNPVRGQTDRRC